MPIVNVRGVGTVNFPDEMSQDQIINAIEKEIIPQYKQHLEKTGPLAALTSSAKGALGSAATAIGEMTGAEGLKKYGAETQQEAAKGYEPTTAADVAAAQGVLPTAKAMFYKQVAEPFAGVIGRYGAPTAAGLLGAAALPEAAGAATLARIAGFALPESQIAAGENIQRQKEVSPEEPVSVAKAETAGVVQALIAGGLSLFGGTLAKPISTLFGKELTVQAAALAPKVISGELTKDAALAAMRGPITEYAKATAQNAAAGAAMMTETEAIRRAQAGQEIASPEAQKVYLQQAEEAAALAPVFGALHAPGQVSKARKIIESAEQAKLPPEEVRVTQTPEALQAQAEKQQAEAVREATTRIGTTPEELRTFGKQFGIGRTAKILREDSLLAGRDITNPEDAAVVKQVLEAYAEGKPAAGAAAKIEEYLKRPEFQEPGTEAENVQPKPPIETVERPTESGIPSIGEGEGEPIRGGTERAGEPAAGGLGEAGAPAEPAVRGEEALRPPVESNAPETPTETAKPTTVRDDGTPVKYVLQKDKPWFEKVKDASDNLFNSYQNTLDRMGNWVTSQHSTMRKFLDAGMPAIDSDTGLVNGSYVRMQAYNDSALTEAGAHYGGLRLTPGKLVEAYDIPGATRDDIISTAKAAQDAAAQAAGGDAARGYDMFQAGMVGPRYEALAKRKEAGLSDPYLGDWTDSDKATAKKAQETIGPYLDNLRSKLNAQREAALDFAESSGLFSKEQVNAYKQAWDYVPFHRVPDEALVDKVGRPITSTNSLLRLGKEYAVKGSDRSVNDVVENHFAKLDNIYRRAIRANAMNAVARDMEQLGIGQWAKRPLTDVEKKKLNYVVIPKNGINKEFLVSDPNDMSTFMAAPLVSNTAINLLSLPASKLRQSITLMPQFLYRQVMMDPARAVIVSGNDAGFIKTYKDAWTSVARSLASETPSPGADALNRLGVVGSVDFMDPTAIQKKYRGEDKKNLFTVGERLAQSSDLAAREAIYNNAIKEATDKGMDPAHAKELAAVKAMAYLPYQQYGNSVVLAGLRRMVPFINATLQGLARDIAAVRGRLPGVDAAQGKKMLALNLAKYAIFTAAYSALRSGDEDYENQNADNRDNNFYIGPIALPAPQELRPLKALVERGTRAWVMNAPQSDMTPEIGAAVLRKAWEIIANVAAPIPAAVKPAIEQMANFNFFTQRPIVGRGLETKEPRFQYTDTTSEIAKMVGNALNLSPARIDHFLRGYFGYIGDTIQKTSNAMSGDRRAANYWETLFLGTALENPYGSGRKQDFYDLYDKVTRAKASYKHLVDNGLFEEAKKYEQENKGYLLADKNVSQIHNELTKLRKEKQNVDLNKNLTPEQKRDRYNYIAQVEAKGLANIRQLQKQVAELNK